jgi:hypothetical protein
MNPYKYIKIDILNFFNIISFVSNFLSKSTNELIDDRFISNDIATLFIDDTKKSINRILLVLV